MNALAYFFIGGGEGAIIDLLVFVVCVLILVWLIRLLIGKL